MHLICFMIILSYNIMNNMKKVIKMKIIDDRRTIIKHNELIEMPYKLSLQEQRLLLIVASLIEKGDTKFQEYHLNIKDLNEILGTKSKNNYSEMRTISRQLMTRVIEYDDGENHYQLHWVNKCKYVNNKGYLVIELGNDVQKYFLQLKEKFTKFTLKYVLRLRSTYSIRLYEMLKQYERIAKRRISVEDLKKKIWIKDGQYPNYSNFKIKVLQQAQREINETTDINFTFSERKQGRKVVEIVFHIKSNNILLEEDKAELLLSDNYNYEHYNKLINYFCLTPNQAQEIIDKYPQKHIDETLKYIEEK